MKMAIKDSVGRGGTHTRLTAGKVFFSKIFEAEMTRQLHVDIFHQPKVIPENTGLNVKLPSSKDYFMLMCGADVTQQRPKVHNLFYLTDARLFLRSSQVSSHAVLAQVGVAG